MSTAKAVVGGIIGISVVLMLIGYLLPAGFTAYHADTKEYTTTLTTTGGITAIGQGVSINLTAANASANATFAVYEIDTLIDTQTVNLAATGDFACPGGTVSVTPSAIAATSATITVEIPSDFRWETGETAMFEVLGLFVFIGLLIAFVHFATDALD